MIATEMDATAMDPLTEKVKKIEAKPSIDEKTVSAELVTELVTMVQNNAKFMDLLRATIEQTVEKKISSIKEEQEKMNGKIHDLEVRCEVQAKALAKLSHDNDEHYDRDYKRTVSITEIEQYCIKNCVLISGVSETPIEHGEEGNRIRENTDKIVIDLVKEKLDIDLKEEDIDCSERKKGLPVVGKPRSIMVKFTRRNTRNKIIRERKKLKGTHIGIQELLTYSKQKLLEEANKMVNEVSRAKAAWSWDGNIYILVESGPKPTRHIVRSSWEIGVLYQKYKDLP